VSYTDVFWMCQAVVVGKGVALLAVGLLARSGAAYIAVGGGLLNARERLFMAGVAKNTQIMTGWRAVCEKRVLQMCWKENLSNFCRALFYGRDVAAQGHGAGRAHSDKMSHIDMADYYIDTVIPHIIRPYPILTSPSTSD